MSGVTGTAVTAEVDPQRDQAMTLPRLGHVAALDGVRGIAVGIVVAHHLRVPGVHGGWLGVDLFFALSGFLITVSLLGTGGGTDLGAFWRRRAWRLGPAMTVFLLWYLAWWLLFDVEGADGDMRLRWWASSVLQVLNIHDAASVHGPFSDYLGHLWSLSAEVQFYVVWPLLLAGLLWLGASRLVVVLVPAGLFVASSIERMVLEADGMQWNRLYLGSDTRSSALWAGCIIGLLYAWGVFERARVLRVAAWVVALPAALVLGLLVAAPSMNFSLERAPYEWGFTVLATCAGLVVAAAATVRGGPLRLLLESPPLEWLGRISYSVYLWHVPLIAEVLRADPDISTMAKAAIVVPATLLVSTVSYLVVERPLLSSRGRARLWGRLRGSHAPVG